MLNEVDPAANRSTGNGSTNIFAYTFEISSESDIEVLVDLVVKTLTTNYTVSGVGASGGGNVTFVTPPANGTTVTLLRKQPASQISDYVPNEAVPAERIEADLDKLVMQIQQVREQLKRGLFLPKSSGLVDQGIDVPSVGSFARGKVGGGIDWATPTNAGPLSSPVSIADGGTGAITAAAARTSLAVPAATNGAMTGAVLTNSTVAANPTAALGIASKGYVDAGIIIGGNLLPNTQWQVCTGLSASTKQLAAGTGAIGSTSVSSYTIGSNTVVLSAADTSLLAVGDIVSMSAAAHANLKICTLEIESIVTNTSFTCKLPINLTGAASAACTATPIVSGDVAGVTGDAADGWSKTSTLLCWRDMWSANVKAGSKYQLGVRKDSASDRLVYHTVPTEDVSAYVGRTIVFGVWVYHKVKGASGTWRVEITTNGTGGTTTASSAATTTAYEWLEVTVTVPTDATTITVGVNFKGNSADVYYISQPMLAYGSRLGSGNYAPQKSEWLIPIVKMTPLSYVGASITFPAVFDATGASYGFAWRVYAETNGAIAPTVRALSMQFEGKDDVLATAFAFRNQESVPHIYGILNYCTVVSQMMSSEGIVTLKSGKAWVYTITSGASWFNCSIDINHIRLN